MQTNKQQQQQSWQAGLRGTIQTEIKLTKRRSPDHYVGPRGLTFTWLGCCCSCFWHKLNELSHSLLFCSCVCFCLYGPLNRISFQKFSRELSAFSLCSSGLISALLVLPTICLFVKVCFSPDIILGGWLGSKHQLTIRLHLSSVKAFFQFRKIQLAHCYQKLTTETVPPNVPTQGSFFQQKIQNYK